MTNRIISIVNQLTAALTVLLAIVGVFFLVSEFGSPSTRIPTDESSPIVASEKESVSLSGAATPEVSQNRAKDAPEKVDTMEKRLDRFLKLQEKVLVSEEEKIELERLLSNPGMLKWVETTLVSSKPSSFAKEAQKKRFEALFFIEKALEWNENPVWDDIIAAVEKLVVAPSIDDRMQPDIKKSIAGDKMELYAMLLRVAPAKAEEILARSRGTRLEKILTYASKRFSL